MRSLIAALRLLRPYQWSKNLLVFVPLFMAHRVAELGAVSHTVLAAIIFSLCASAAYAINDLLDLEADRRHPHKRFRPIAAGEITPRAACAIAVALLVASAALCTQVDPQLALVVFSYFILTVLYSLLFKRLIALDVVTLATLYTLRLFAGGIAAGVPISPWLMGFSLFFFFSLACAKRHAELFRVRSELAGGAAPRRGYTESDLETMEQMGVASGFISVLVLALFVYAPEVEQLYRQRALLWLLCPIFLYWNSRLWLLVRRGVVSEDPLLFAVHDRASYLSGLVAMLVIYGAR